VSYGVGAGERDGNERRAMGKSGFYTMKEAREIARRAARATLREQGKDPAEASADDALAVLDDLCRSKPELVASYWYGAASERQFKLFCREWNRR
jgi:hypothetical protein